MDYETFEGQVGRTYTITFEDAAVVLTVDNIKRNDHIPMRDNHIEIEGEVIPPRVPFTVVFSGPAEPILQANTYVMTDPDGQDVAIFVTPFRADQTETLYEAVYS